MKALLRQAYEIGSKARQEGKALRPNDSAELMSIMPNNNIYDTTAFRSRIKMYDAYMAGWVQAKQKLNHLCG